MDEAEKFRYLTEPVLGFNLPTPKFKLLLTACEDHQILTCKPEKEIEINKVFERINKKLGVPISRHVGILLLKTFLPQCYDEIFAQNGIHWMNECINVLNEEETSMESVGDAYELLASLFELSGKFVQLKGPMSREVVNKFFNAVNRGKTRGITDQYEMRVLHCIKPLMKHYAAACQLYRKHYVWNFLWKSVHSSDTTLVTIAGECMCYFTQDPTNDGRKQLPKRKVRDLTVTFSKLCTTANDLLFKIFQDRVQMSLHGRELPPVGFEIIEVERKVNNSDEEDVVNSLGKSGNHFVNVLSLMEGILRNDTEFPKNLFIEHALTVAYQALKVSCLNIQHDMGTVEHIAVLSLLPTIQAAVYNFLRCLVTCCEGLLCYGPLFCKFVLETLQWTEAPCVSGNERRFGYIREAAYLFLEAWAIRAKAGSCVEIIAEELVPLLLQDVIPKGEEVTLQMKSQSGKVQQYLTKKKLINPQANAETCGAALRALCAIIEASGSLLKAHHHLMLQETVVSLLLEVRRSNLENMPSPYSSPECRLQLYRVLLALTLHPNGSWPAPLQFALALFPYGQTDPSLKVSSFCLLANATTRQIVHPSRCNAQFPISLEEMRVSAGLKENPSNFSVQGQILRGERVDGESELNAIKRRDSTLHNGISPKVAKRKLPTQTFVTSLNRTEGNTPETSPIKNCAPASKKKKLAPVVNGDVSRLKNALNSNLVQKKKSKLSLDTSVAVSVSPLPSSERPLKKKRSLSESPLGSLDHSGCKNMLRSSLDSWTVVDLPQQESSKKKKKKNRGKKQKQADEESVDAEPPSKKKQRVHVSETPSEKIPISSDIWNVSVTPSHKISPKKSFTQVPFNGIEDPVQQEKLRRLKSAKAKVMQLHNNLEKIIGKGKGEASLNGKENIELRKERPEVEEEMIKKTEKENIVTDVAQGENEVSVDQKPLEDTSPSQTTTHEKPPLVELSPSSVDKSQVKQPTSPIRKSNTISEGVIKISDEKPQKDETSTPVKDFETSKGGVDITGHKETSSPSGEKPQEGKPLTPVKMSKDFSEESVKVSDAVTIEEIPLEEVGSASEKPSSVSAARDAPIVDLADSDNSCSVISLGSEGKEERSQKESAVNTSFEVCQDPDAATGMDAVVESPRISLEGTTEETTECAAGATSEKTSKTSEDIKKDSDTDEEDILTTFVDIVSTTCG